MELLYKNSFMCCENLGIKTKNLLVSDPQEDNNLHASHLSGFHLLELAPLNI
jgi:hypothetical protein